MIEEHIRQLLAVPYEKRLLIQDEENLRDIVDYPSFLEHWGYHVAFYTDREAFRYLYESEIRDTDGSWAVIFSKDRYIPYDIRQVFHKVTLAWETLYPVLDGSLVRQHLQDLPLLDFSYQKNAAAGDMAEPAASYVQQVVLGKENIEAYLQKMEPILQEKAEKTKGYQDWIAIAKENAQLEYYAASIGRLRDQSQIDKRFREFLFAQYSRLSGEVSKESPVMLPKVWDWLMARGKKTALLVADGMSLFDFAVLSRCMKGFHWQNPCAFAMLPTVTCISRQGLLSGKYPVQLESPFTQNKEKSGFYEAAASYGLDRSQAFYGRGYEARPPRSVQFAAIIVNTVDEMVHGQQQGRIGMYQADRVWAESGEMQTLFSDLLNQGFDVFLTADHGNTACIGQGSIGRTGVETATRSKRMIVFKPFANVTPLVEEMTDLYPGYYLDRMYQYRICKGRSSFDPKGTVVMSHGGMSLEEVIVPFVHIERV